MNYINPRVNAITSLMANYGFNNIKGNDYII